MKRGFLGSLLVMAATVLATVFSLGTARADITPPTQPQAWSEIFNPYLHAQGITLCWDDPNGSTSEGALQQLYHCHGYASNGAPQRWEFDRIYTANGFLQVDPITGNPLYHIYNDAAHLCLSFAALSSGVDQLSLVSCSNTFVGTWELMSDNAVSQNGRDFQVRLYTTSFEGQFCAAASNFSDNNNTRLVLASCDPYDTRQIWNLG